ncbi:MAG: HNH endonuclease signature motif containing protein, partial [Dermatophilaceae bacterium]
GSPSAVHVTISLADLQAVTGCGEVLASVASQAVLGPGQLRRIACDAALIPYVLGSRGEVVDQGMTVRLFTRAQRRRLWLRDGGCTYPGCTAPGAWCRAHHVRHWADSGPTDIDNAALLCERHHTLVHQRRLWARVRELPDDHGRYVTWDLHHGSYDRALNAINQREVVPGDAVGGHERHRAEARARVLTHLRDALADHDEQVLATWYALPIDDACREIDEVSLDNDEVAPDTSQPVLCPR